MPEGYVFLNPKLFESKKAWDVTDGMLETASKRDPDRFGMYIYNGECSDHRQAI